MNLTNYRKILFASPATPRHETPHGHNPETLVHCRVLLFLLRLLAVFVSDCIKLNHSSSLSYTSAKHPSHSRSLNQFVSCAMFHIFHYSIPSPPHTHILQLSLLHESLSCKLITTVCHSA